MYPAKICPKCGGTMEMADSLSGGRLIKLGDALGDRVVPFYCKNCGYIELYVDKILRKR